MLGNKVVVLGGTGFVGRAVVNELSKNGYETKVAVRRPERYREFLLFPDTRLATLDSYDDAEQLQALVSDADIVVNLISDLTAGTENIPTKEIVSITQQIKKAVESSGVQRVVSLSQIGADANNAENQWLCELGEADAVLMALANVEITVLRASLLLGEGDDLVSSMRKQLKLAGILPIANGSTEVQPLAIADFARAMVVSIKDEATFGQKIEVAGEERLTIKQLAELLKELMGKESALVFPMCDLNAKFMAFLGVLSPVKSVTESQLMTLCTDLTTDNDFATQFGFVPKSLRQTLMGYVVPTGMRERYHFYRQEAGRNSQDLV